MVLQLEIVQIKVKCKACSEVDCEMGNTSSANERSFHRLIQVGRNCSWNLVVHTFKLLFLLSEGRGKRE